MHQYALDTVVDHGGIEMKIDKNLMDVGRGSVAPKARATCGVRVDFADYKLIRRGATGAQVKAAQCLLKTDTPISRLRGREFNYRDAVLIPTFHPAYLLRNPSSKREVWEDMKRVKAILESSPKASEAAPR